MAMALPHAKGAYCKVRTAVFVETCHVPFESGWVTEPRGLRKGEVVEPDHVMELASVFLDNSINIPLMDSLVLYVWVATWIMYLTVAFGVMFTVAWCRCMNGLD